MSSNDHRSPTKFMERPGKSADDEKAERVSIDSPMNAKSKHTSSQPQPDKDWYRKWQKSLSQGDKEARA